MRKGVGCGVALALVLIVGLLGTMSAEREAKLQAEASAAASASQSSTPNLRGMMAEPSVRIDRTTGRMSITGRVSRDFGDSVWVWAYLTYPGAGGTFSDVSVQVPLSPGTGDPMVQATWESVHWWRSGQHPKDGWLARVYVGRTAEEAQVRARDRPAGTEGMVPVQSAW